MPLSQSETFKAKLQRHGRLAVPRLLRWRYKLEPGELFSVEVRIYGSENFEHEAFLAKMASDGRITVPKLTMEILQKREEKDLTGCIFEVTLDPASQEADAPPSTQTKPAENTEDKLLGKIDDIRRTLKDQ